MPKQPNKNIRKRVGRYSDQIRQQAAIEYATCGNIATVSKSTDIPETTLCMWKNSGTWDNIITEVRTQKQEEHIATYTKIVDKAQAITLAKLPEATAAQANIIAATATDKTRLLLNQPTSISGKGEGIQELLATFRKISQESAVKALEGKQVIEIIEVAGSISEG